MLCEEFVNVEWCGILWMIGPSKCGVNTVCIFSTIANIDKKCQGLEVVDVGRWMTWKFAERGVGEREGRG